MQYRREESETVVRGIYVHCGQRKYVGGGGGGEGREGGSCDIDKSCRRTRTAQNKPRKNVDTYSHGRELSDCRTGHTTASLDPTQAKNLVHLKHTEMDCMLVCTTDAQTRRGEGERKQQ